MGAIRRDKGTGSVRLRGDGRWEARYTGVDRRSHSLFVRDRCKSGSHRPDRRCTYERDAEKRLQAALAATEAGLNPSLAQLADYVDTYIVRRSRDWQPDTIRRYTALAAHIRKAPHGRIPIARLRPDDLDDLYANRLAAGMAPKGLELLHTLVHGALGEAAKRGHVLRNVADVVTRPKVRRTVRPTYTGDQLRALLDAAEGHRIDGVVAIAATVGLRIGEILALRWPDIDLEVGRIIIANPEKGGTPRTILIAPRVARILRAHRARQLERRLRAGGAYEDTDLAFANAWGEPLGQRTILDELAAIAAAAGLPPVTWRALRHAVATKLTEDGLPVKVIQEILGHRTATQTLDTYSHVTPTMQRAAVEAITRAVGE